MTRLLPVPRQVDEHEGTLTLPTEGVIQLDSAARLFEGQFIQQVMENAGLNWSLQVAPTTTSPALRLYHTDTLNAQGYRLVIDNAGISVYGDSAGLFYGLCTLRQIIMQYAHSLPLLSIEDWPDYPQRGVMLDISRDKVPTMNTLKHLIDTFASLKINQLQLYVEHTFAFPDHEQVWQHASPLTAEDILILDAYCQQRHIQLVPNQNSLGHMERWLKYRRYRRLAETPGGFVDPWGRERSASTLNPLDSGSLELISELYDALLPQYTSPLFNVGCDEPWELGQGKSKEAVEAHGGRVYLDWLHQLHEEVTRRGRQMMFWGDIIIKYPELVPELPGSSIVLEWGYEANHPFAEHGKLFAQSGIPFYVCPGTSSWNALVGRTDNAMGNLRAAAQAGLENGAVGYLNTDWGDNGHFQPMPASYIGFAYGAAVSWCVGANSEVDLAAALDTFIYEDDAGVMGKLTMALGNVYKLTGPEHINGQPLAYALAFDQQAAQARVSNLRDGENLSPETLRRVLARIDVLINGLASHQMKRPDADLIVEEWIQAASLLAHGGKWLLLVQGEKDHSPADLLAELDGLIAQQRENWLARNRRGGLDDSVRRLDPLRNEYLRLMDT